MTAKAINPLRVTLNRNERLAFQYRNVDRDRLVTFDLCAHGKDGVATTYYGEVMVRLGQDVAIDDPTELVAIAAIQLQEGLVGSLGAIIAKSRPEQPQGPLPG